MVLIILEDTSQAPQQELPASSVNAEETESPVLCPSPSVPRRRPLTLQFLVSPDRAPTSRLPSSCIFSSSPPEPVDVLSPRSPAPRVSLLSEIIH